MNVNTETPTPTNVTPLYQRGCKITAGARAGPPPPSWRDAKMLVLARRASSRILKPAAATAIQKMYKKRMAERMAERTAKQEQAAITITKACHAHRARVHAHRARVQRALAATTLQSAARRHQATQRRLAMLARIRPAAARLQARARGAIARRHLAEARAAACSIQATWRRVAIQVVGRRLAGATARLQAGSVLAKYRQKGGLTHERHERFVWLSRDRRKLCWTDPAERDARRSEADSTKSVSMSAVAAVSAGVKTELMKKMERRADREEEAWLTIRRPAELLRAGVAKRPMPLDASCAFSLIGRERVLDLVAPDEGKAGQWLRDLRTLLVFANHLDHKAAVGAVGAGMRRGSLAEPAAAAA